MTQYALPTELEFQRTRFKINWGNTPVRTRRGGSQVVNFADPVWEITLKTPDSLTSAQMLAFTGWLDRMEGGLHTFLAHDEALPYAQAYPDGYDDLGFSGLASASSIAARIITVTGLPAGFQFSMGDYLGLVQSSRYSLHRVVGAVTANGSGIADNVPVVPPIKTELFNLTATVNLLRPLAEFVPDPDSWDPESVLRFAPGIPFQFGAYSRVV